MEAKNDINKKLMVTVVILSIVVLGLIGYICCDKFLLKDNASELNTPNNKTQNTENVSYEVGESLTVKLNDNLSEKFFVIEASGTEKDTVKLLASKIVGESEFNDSAINSKLNQLSQTWKNVKSVRLITLDELISTKEVKIEKECRDSLFGAACEEMDYYYTKTGSWLVSSSEKYWTMTKDDNDNNYVYLVDGLTNEINVYLSSEKNGLKPVIEISKEYVSK